MLTQLINKVWKRFCPHAVRCLLDLILPDGSLSVTSLSGFRHSIQLEQCSSPTPARDLPLSLQMLVYYKSASIAEPTMTTSDRLICPVRAEASFMLVPGNSWESSARDIDTIDYSSINYETHAWLAELKYQRVKLLSPGNCIYVPHGW